MEDSASYRDVTRVKPEILKLDRTLVCGIESEGELTCLVDLAVGCGQGFFLGLPELGGVESRISQLAAR